MKEKKIDLQTVEEFLEKYAVDKDDYLIVVKNPKEKREGVAVLLDDGRIKVYEGNGDGSDDGIYNKIEFNEKYKIKGITRQILQVTLQELKNDLQYFASKYKETLIRCLIKLRYISNTISIFQCNKEIKAMSNEYLKSNQINEIIENMLAEMKGDAQYKYFKILALEYMDISNSSKEIEELETNSIDEKEIVFMLNGKEILAYNLCNEFIGEQTKTIKILAKENKCNEEEIKVIMRTIKTDSKIVEKNKNRALER